MKANDVKAKCGDTITLRENSKEPSKGKVVATQKRQGYFDVNWSDGRKGHVNKRSKNILTVNGKGV
jgi:hypothetical protein